MERLVIPRSLYEAMIEHARAASPLESCGLLAGRGDEAVRFFPTANAAASEVRYRIDPQDILDIQREIDRAGLELVAIFHSHPATAAYPSPTDVELAYYPEAVYLIASLADPHAPVLRGFRIVEQRVTETALEIV